VARHRCLENPPDGQGIDSDICAQTDPMILIRLRSWKLKPKFERMLICSSCLSDNFLLRVGLDPRRWCEPFDTTHDCGIGQINFDETNCDCITAIGHGFVQHVRSGSYE